MITDLKTKMLAALDQAEDYRGLVVRARNRGEREAYERIVDHYVMIADELESCCQPNFGRT